MGNGVSVLGVSPSGVVELIDRHPFRPQYPLNPHVTEKAPVVCAKPELAAQVSLFSKGALNTFETRLLRQQVASHIATCAVCRDAAQHTHC